MRRALLPLGFSAIFACAAFLPGEEANTFWWKGNTHTHTLWSDGDGAPELVTRWYRDRGYHFLVLSDHNVLSTGETWYPVTDDGALRPEHLDELGEYFGADWVVTREDDEGLAMRLKTLAEVRERLEGPGEFILLPGEEISDGFLEKPVHVNGLNLAEAIPPQGGATLLETLERNVDAVLEQGRRLDRPVLAHVNHPNFYWAIDAETIARVRGERFFEIYNGHPLVENYGDEEHLGVERMWDAALTLRFTELELDSLYGLATDDAHSYHATGISRSNPGRGWIVVRASELTAESLIEAMNRGDFYASTGVTLRDVSTDGERFVVEVEAEDRVDYTTSFVGTRALGDGPGEVGEVLAQTTDNPAVYTFEGDEIYVRAKIVSSRLQANPYATGDLESAWVQPVRPGK